MNTQKSLQAAVLTKEPKLLNIAFNQDQSCFAVCSEKGFKVYSTYPMELKMERDFTKIGMGHKASKIGKLGFGDDLEQIDAQNNNGTIKTSGSGIGIIKMLYKTNYVALVGGGKKPRFPLNKLCIWDDLKEKDSIIIEFTTPILNVHLSRTHIIVVLKNMVLVYSFKLKPELVFSFETIDNEQGLSEHTTTENSSVLVFPGRTPGQLHIVDISNKKKSDLRNVDEERKTVSLIKAHKNRIQCVCLSPSGKMIASASTLGTIIRVHDTRNCALLNEFRRGLDSAIITDMKFSPDGTKLAVLSDKNTLHIYHVYGEDEHDKNKTHILKGLPLFPTYFKSTWSFVSKDVSNKQDLVNDVGTLGWSDVDSVIIIWKYKGIWEKYDIIMNNSNPTDAFYGMENGNHHNGNNNDKSIKWQIVKEGWRSVY